LIITKNLGNSSAVWATYSKVLGKDKLIELNSTSAAQPVSNYWGTSSPSSNVFGLSTNSAHYNANGSQIAYCWHSVSGYSKIDSYVGDGGTNNFISTGFEPAFVMIKRTDDTSNWRIFDNKRGTQKELYANSSAAEPPSVSYINFNDLGFTLTNSGGWINNLNGKFIYMAFAAS
jgi:hypothetical protein